MNNDNGRIGFSLELSNDRIKQDIKEAKRLFQDLDNEVRNDCTSMDNSFKNLGKTISMAFTFTSASLFINQVVKVRGEIESLEKSFEILAGTVQGKKLFAGIKDFAVSTPMMMQDLAKGAQTLLAFNTAAEDVMPILRAIGDISMGNAQRFESLVLAFSQMSSTGKLMGQDLLQMINAGFNPLSVISEQTGKSIGVLKEEMAAGSISADMIKKAFMDATSAGGKFYNMLQIQSEGIEGLKSNFEGAVEDMYNAIGERLQDIISGSIKMATSVVANYEKVGKCIAELVAAYGTYKAAVIVLSTIEKLRYQATLAQMAGMTKMQVVTDILRMKTEALNVALAKNPYVAVGIAIAAFGYAMYKLITYQTDAEKAQEKLNETTANFNKEVASERVQIDSLFARLKSAKEGTDEYKTVKQSIINQYGSYLEGLSAEIQSLQDIEGAYNAVTAAAKEAAKARAMESALKDAGDTYAEVEADAKDEIFELLQEKYKGQVGSDGISLAKTYYWKIVPVLEGQEEMTEEVQSIINSFNQQKLIATGLPTYGGANYQLYTANDVQDEIDKVIRARDIYDRTITETQRRFGKAPQTQDSGSDDDSGAEEIIVKNKKFWEDYLKGEQAKLDALAESELQTQKAKDIRANIREAQTKIDAYTKSSSGRTVAQMVAEIDNANQAVKQAQESGSQERIDTEMQLHFRQEQNRINLEKDAAKRKEMQMKLDFEKELYNLDQQKRSAVEAEKKRQKAVFDATEDVKKAQNKDYQKKTFSDADINQSEIDKIVNQYSFLNSQILSLQTKREEDERKVQADAMNQYLREYGSYQEQRMAIKADYDRRINEAATKGEKMTLVEQMNKELSDLDIEAKKATSAISKLFDDMRDKTVGDMRAIADAGEEALQFLISGKWNADKGIELGISEETFKVLAKSPEELEKIRKAIKEITDQADQADGAFGKMAKGLEKVFKAGEKTNELEEGLSLIESGMSDCLQVGQFLSDSLENLGDALGSDALSGAAEGINVAMDAASSAMSGAQAGQMFGPWGAAAGAAIGLVTSLASSLAKLHDTKHEKKIQKLQSEIELLAKNYEKLSDSIEKAYSKDASQLIDQQNTLLEQQKVFIQQQIKEEEAKKKTDKERIKNWKEEIEEIDKLISDNKEKMIDAIFGEDVESAIENFSDALVDAWAAGENKAESTKDVVKKMMRQMVTESIKAAIQSSGAMEQIRTKLQEFYADNVFSAWEQDYIYRMAENLQHKIDSQFGWADDLMTDPKDEDTERQGTSKSSITASQESVDESNARLTTMQGHTFQIAGDTAAMRQASLAMQERVRELRDMSYEAIEHLEAISRNTFELYETNKRLKSIENGISDINTKGVYIKN